MRLTVQALGQGDTETRSIPSGNLEVAVLDRTRAQQRKFKQAEGSRPAGDPRQRPERAAPGDGTTPDGPGPSTDPSGPDDPADPTDTAGATPPLEDPVTGEPNRPDDDPPVAPPAG